MYKIKVLRHNQPFLSVNQESLTSLSLASDVREKLVEIYPESQGYKVRVFRVESQEVDITENII